MTLRARVKSALDKAEDSETQEEAKHLGRLSEPQDKQMPMKIYAYQKPRI